jgi:quercetin dioxygenase-like cupin family protein
MKEEEMKLGIKHLFFAFAGLAAGVLATVAVASTGFGFTPVNFVPKADLNQTVHLNSDRVKFQTKDPTDVRVQQVTYLAGGRSGWHHHPGFVLAAVQSGQLTVWDSNCQAKTYGPGLPDGAVFVEYGDSPLQVGNTGETSAVVYAAYVAPNAEPPVFRIEDDPPACA